MSRYYFDSAFSYPQGFPVASSEFSIFRNRHTESTNVDVVATRDNMNILNETTVCRYVVTHMLVRINV